jgi:hypothetical protein
MHTGRRDYFGDGVDGVNTVAYLPKARSVKPAMTLYYTTASK